MNLGQIYETVLGWAGKTLGVKFATPIFDGATLEQITSYTDKAGVPAYGKLTYMMEELVRNSTNLQQLELSICLNWVIWLKIRCMLVQLDHIH
jgi:hypothetical protein